MTINDLKGLICHYFSKVEPSDIDVYCNPYIARFDGTIYLTINADVLSQDVNQLLRDRAPITYRFITVTAGWSY